MRHYLGQYWRELVRTLRTMVPAADATLDQATSGDYQLQLKVECFDREKPTYPATTNQQQFSEINSDLTRLAPRLGLVRGLKHILCDVAQ